MRYFWINPLEDSRWDAFVAAHPWSSVFHTSAWLKALRRTYGYAPVAVTMSPPGQELENGVVFCRVESVLTGKRLISLPFSDHCQPLASDEALSDMAPEMMGAVNREHMKYGELRPLATGVPGEFAVSQRCFFHVVDLRPSIEEIHRKLHADCIRRKIRRAEKEGLTSDAGRSDKLLDEFFALQVITRRRFGLPPQPKGWFRNLLAAMGENAVIRVARHEGRAVAAILTLRHKNTAVYKYGCSDVNDSYRGGTQLILWQEIEEAKSEGREALDLGRCDLDDTGLAVFKERWGAARRELNYYRYPLWHKGALSGFGIMKEILTRLPAPVLVAAGRLLYRHMA
ncbi:MAG TPA: GNAT family N-acetyltransferase [Acidobacteriota bacterium]|nr:GNAT family N-acetyltransferase [Acidobacteriota bacterium]